LGKIKTFVLIVFYMKNEFLYNTPLGKLLLQSNDVEITSILFMDEKSGMQNLPTNIHNPIIENCIHQLQAYFDGNLKIFTIPTQQQGTEFQQTVWQALTTIPYGKTISYLQLSKQINNPKAIRAVGTTNGKNKLSIVVPCHRVIGSNGSLTGYSGGLWRKNWLLAHEAKYANGVATLF
jgi:methylated-DNA-[protein]-cysteine S-methyltransferase